MTTIKIQTRSWEKMNNGAWRRAGEPRWWARIGDEFLDIGRVRGDSPLNVEVEVDAPAGTVVEYGVGKGNGAIRGSVTVEG